LQKVFNPLTSLLRIKHDNMLQAQSWKMQKRCGLAHSNTQQYTACQDARRASASESTSCCLSIRGPVLKSVKMK
jgi:hypothetical protein